MSVDSLQTVIIKDMGYVSYLETWHAMQEFTNQRTDTTFDEIWMLEHPAIFTQGQNGKSEHLLDPGPIPVIKVDRGGQVTYHGPGQLVVYTLIDLKRKKLTIRDIVSKLEFSIIDLLAEYNIKANAKREAPGVYVDNEKICSIGLRVRKSCAYHGLAFNVMTDLNAFSRINPCGFSGLKMTNLEKLLPPSFDLTLNAVGKKLIPHLLRHFGYTNATL